MKEEKKKIFRCTYPCGPCPNKWKNCICGCGWEYNEEEVIEIDCTDGCEICEYCGNQKCPKCNEHLHCGGCI